MKKQTITLIAGALLAGGVLAGCGNQEAEEPKEEPKQEEQAAEENQAEQNSEGKENDAEQNAADTNTEAEVNAYQAMMESLSAAKEGNEVEWDKVKSEYQNNLQEAVTAVNGEFDQAIQAAISAGQSGELDANVARQIIDKTTQSYFYQKHKGLHSDTASAIEAGNTEAASKIFEDLNLLIDEVIIPTAEKRDSYYELSGEDSIVENINSGLKAQTEALDAGNADDFGVYKQITDKSIYRSYYLAAQSYAEKVEKAVQEGNADETELKIMQAEGWGFLQAIKGSLAGGDEEAANKLNDLFSLDKTEPSAIKSEEVSQLFTDAFAGKITSYHEKVPAALEEGEVAEARTEAMEANVFLKAIEMDLADKLGEEQAESLLDKAQKWYEAVAAENAEEASKLSEEITSSVKEVASK
ncbi:hypothetical protein [Bacillus marinisedimentorum]|uniref:hypothetical protein n=1 Tax=Bacillus marinisedimentorum TaxID=1821260 RepID=UPI00087240AD|nr:hypothetical protein [Bacillus marinisedimentorum]